MRAPTVERRREFPEQVLHEDETAHTEAATRSLPG
ncbi:hypothetical protein JOJ86_005126 [Rhodococcus percolatus]|nr:hypothetical protein [Rhodococcus opacus]MBP2207400.1 hypothetical protein [Rhodococcus opacus]